MSESRASLIAFLTSLRDHYGNYHNHKETIAWASVALYLAGALQVAVAASSTKRPTRLVLGIVVLVATLSIIAYVRRQFILRRYAAGMVRSTLRLLALAVSGKLDHIKTNELAPSGVMVDYTFTLARRPASPTYLHRIAVAIQTPFRWVFPPYLPANANADLYPAIVIQKMEESPRDHRIFQLETLTYLLILLIGVGVSLLLIWF